jgi:hypothetical protein
MVRKKVPRRKDVMRWGKKTNLLENVGGDVGKRDGLLRDLSEVCRARPERWKRNYQMNRETQG